MVVRTHGLKKSQVTNIRYSVDIDPDDPTALSLQVHCNEPLSRELQAFPVCIIPMPLSGTTLSEVYLRFLQSMWFLKKLFDFHQEVEASSVRRRVTTSGSTRLQPRRGDALTPRTPTRLHQVPSPVVTPPSTRYDEETRTHPTEGLQVGKSSSRDRPRTPRPQRRGGSLLDVQS